MYQGRVARSWRREGGEKISAEASLKILRVIKSTTLFCIVQEKSDLLSALVASSSSMSMKASSESAATRVSQRQCPA